MKNRLKTLSFISIITFATMLIYWTYEIIIWWSFYIAKPEEYFVHRRYRHFIDDRYFWFSVSLILIILSHFILRSLKKKKLKKNLYLLWLIPAVSWLSVVLTCLMIHIYY